MNLKFLKSLRTRGFTLFLRPIDTYGLIRSLVLNKSRGTPLHKKYNGATMLMGDLSGTNTLLKGVKLYKINPNNLIKERKVMLQNAENMPVGFYFNERTGDFDGFTSEAEKLGAIKLLLELILDLQLFKNIYSKFKSGGILGFKNMGL